MQNFLIGDAVDGLAEQVSNPVFYPATGLKFGKVSLAFEQSAANATGQPHQPTICERRQSSLKSWQAPPIPKAVSFWLSSANFWLKAVRRTRCPITTGPW